LVPPEDTHVQLQTVVAEWRELGDPRLTALALNTLSWSAMRLGKYDEARAALEESVGISSSIGDRWGLGFAYRGLGSVEQRRGDHLRAVEMFHKGLDTLDDLGARQDVARVLAEMGRSIYAMGDDVEAGRTWREALRIAFELGEMFVALEALLGLATLQSKQGENEHAYELVQVILNHSASIQDTRTRASLLCNALEEKLTHEQVEEARVRGRNLSLEEVVSSQYGINRTISR
jgi:tetratricopeptide (TPR) repeat protein